MSETAAKPRCEACDSKAVLEAARGLKTALSELSDATHTVGFTLDSLIYAYMDEVRSLAGSLDHEGEHSQSAVQVTERAIARLKKAAATLRGVCPP